MVILRRALALALLLASAAPAFAVKEWYDHYADGEAAMRRGRWQEALKSLQEAVRLKPESELNARPYGMEFVQYLPYYQQGICYLRSGDFNSAQRMFNIEEDKGAIKRSELFRELRRLRAEAESNERQRLVRLARDEAARLLKEANELFALRKLDEALARLASAGVVGGGLDATLQRQVGELRERIRAEQRAASEAADRARRLEGELSEGRRLLEAGQATEAIVHFDQVLGLDPGNRAASEGKRDAQERILASRNRQALETAFQEGRALFDAGRYQDALRPLTDAAADPQNAAARDYLNRAQRILEGLRQQREMSQRIAALLQEAETLLAARKYPEALVRFESVLALDPAHARGRERRDFAEMMTGEEHFSRFFPNRAPGLTIVEPAASELVVSGPRSAVVGVATDELRIAKLEFFQDGRLVGEETPPARAEAGEATPTLQFQREFELKPGPNEIAVVATDNLGLKRREVFRLTRRLRFYETRAFLPSAAVTALGLVALGLALQSLRRRRAVRERFNPYIAGAPVMDEALFFGRQRLLARILNVLHHNSLMITGERRIGKTTFLYHLRRALEADEGTEYRFFPAFIDLQGVSEQDFFHAVMSDVIEGVTASAETLAALRFRPDDDHYDGRDFSHDLQRLIEELKARTPKRVKLALLIDEVDVLNEFSERINQRLRSIFMKTFSENLVAIMSGVGIRRTWTSEGSPWYNFFDEIELQAFTREDAEALIRTPVGGIFRYEPEAVEAILRLSDQKPYLIQRYCIYAINRIIEQRRTSVTASDVEGVREDVQFEGRVPEEPGRPRPAATA